MNCVDRLNSSVPSGGTLASFLTMLETLPVKTLLQALKPYALSPVPNPHPNPKRSFVASITGLVNVPGLGRLSTSPTGSMNAALVHRTWGLMQQEASLQRHAYGSKFTYQELMTPPNALAGIMVHYGLIVGLTAMLLPPVRALMRWLAFNPGEGPDKEQAKKDRIEFRAIANPDGEFETKKQAHGSLSYTGSMYYCKF